MVPPAAAGLVAAAAEAAAFAATIPLMPKNAMPRVVRAALTITLVPLLWNADPFRAYTESMTMAVVERAIAGAAFGLAAAIVAGAVNAAGDAIDIALGSPPFAQRAPSGGPIGLLYQLAYAVVLLQSGGLTRIICQLAVAGDALPHPLLNMRGLAALGSASFHASFLLAGPMLFAQALATVAAGIVARAAPQVGGALFSGPLVGAAVLCTVTVGAAALWPELAELVRQTVQFAKATAQ
ncbi:MAG: flagellar biosynthetic protein FliR [Candidatus Eremiobacteraeota bacterium]|nr:flagellar biosynthetic protein FliR [Candidatus Eremiobacteraeota bacterium]